MNEPSPRALVVLTAGINCDRELSEAFRLAGARPVVHHLNELMADPSLVDGFDLVGFPGGFGYGDAVAAGRVEAALMRETLYPAFARAVERGVPMIAPCNGFQVAVQLGLLPGTEPPLPESAPRPTVALMQNDSARFVDRWVRMEIPADTRCIWTRDLAGDGDAALIPIAHGEGRFVAASDDVLDALEANGQIAMRYAAGDNPNGSVRHVAGICDPTGLVFGLMPHPERWLRWEHHPWWTRLAPELRQGDPPGLAMFRNAVALVRERAGAGAIG